MPTHMYSHTCSHLQQKIAEQILTQFKDSQEVWTQVDGILELSNNLNTKYFALQVLEILIKTRWKALPREQCEGMAPRLHIHAFLEVVVLKSGAVEPQYELS